MAYQKRTDLQHKNFTDRLISGLKHSGETTSHEQHSEAGSNLIVAVTPTNSKIFKIRITSPKDGKTKVKTIGKYKEYSLQEAREKAFEMAKVYRNGEDWDEQNAKFERGLAQTKKLSKPFLSWAEEYINSESFKEATVNKKNKHIKGLSHLHNVALIEIEIVDLIPHFDAIANEQKYEKIYQQIQLLKLVFEYAARELSLTQALTQENNSELNRIAMIKVRLTDLNEKYAKQKPKEEHLPALQVHSDVAKLMRDIFAYQGRSQVVGYLIRLTPYLMLRPKELRCLRWEWVDFESKLLRFPQGFLKMGDEHLVPLSIQALHQFKELHNITGHTDFVFFMRDNKGNVPSENAVNQALKRMGYAGKQTAHGFRTTATTLINERHSKKFRPDWIDKQLAHKGKNKTAAIYNRAEYLDERREMMQVWSDMIDDMLQS